MKVEYVGNGSYIGTLNWNNGASVVYGKNRWDVMKTLIKKAFHDHDEVQPKVVEEPEPVKNDEPTFRYDEEAWTDDDWEREHRRDEIIGQHKDDDKI